MTLTANRILCLGSNSKDTDFLATDIAEKYSLINRGLITEKYSLKEEGVYHTTLVDMSQGNIIDLSHSVDCVIMLDQPRSEWTHWKILQSTYKTMTEIERLGRCETVFRDNRNVQSLMRIESLVLNSPSWCIYPWINLVAKDNTGLKLCVRSGTTISKEISAKAWTESPMRKRIKEKMLSGQKIPEHCDCCYRQENLGIESYRQYESRDWLNQLDVDILEQLPDFSKPLYYEIYWSNRCNLKCRGCVPSRSSAIAAEFRRHSIKMPFSDKMPQQMPTIDIVDIANLRRNNRVYVTGGEPLIMPETLEFMRRCIDAGNTDFELTMSVNGVKIPDGFIKLSRHFSNLNLTFSLDGYREVNDYWRTGSRWDAIVTNMHRMQDLGHNITINTVPGIYNVTNLHRLFQWLDQEFPLTKIYLQVNHNPIQSAYNHPNTAMVIESMRSCQTTRVYWSDGKSCRTAIDSILDHYMQNPTCDLDSLRAFFDYNDKLDHIRAVRLSDHIPELEACRQLIQ